MKIIKRALELDEKGTAGPGEPVSDLPMFSVWSSKRQQDVISSQNRRYCAPSKHHHGTCEIDAELIATYRSAAPKLARALEVAIKQLKCCGYTALYEDVEGTLAEIRKMLGEE